MKREGMNVHTTRAHIHSRAHYWWGMAQGSEWYGRGLSSFDNQTDVQILFLVIPLCYASVRFERACTASMHDTSVLGLHATTCVRAHLSEQSFQHSFSTHCHSAGAFCRASGFPPHKCKLHSLSRRTRARATCVHTTRKYIAVHTDGHGSRVRVVR